MLSVLMSTCQSSCQYSWPMRMSSVRCQNKSTPINRHARICHHRPWSREHHDHRIKDNTTQSTYETDIYRRLSKSIQFYFTRNYHPEKQTVASPQSHCAEISRARPLLTAVNKDPLSIVPQHSPWAATSISLGTGTSTYPQGCYRIRVVHNCIDFQAAVFPSNQNTIPTHRAEHYPQLFNMPPKKTVSADERSKLDKQGQYAANVRYYKAVQQGE